VGKASGLKRKKKIIVFYKNFDYTGIDSFTKNIVFQAGL